MRQINETERNGDKENRETEEKKRNGWRGKQDKGKIIRRRSKEREKY